MTVVNLGMGRLIGLSSDSKPTTYPNGTIFIESDTGAQYQYIGSVWNKTVENRGALVHPGIKRTGSFQAFGGAPNSPSGTSGTLTGYFATLINVGTAGFTGIQRNAVSGINGGNSYRMTTGATAASQAGFRGGAAVAPLTREYNPRFDFKIKLNQTTNERIGFGFLGSVSAPLAGTEPAGTLPAVMFWLDTSVDANWHILQNLSSATSDKTTIANVAAADTNAHVFSIRAVNASSKWQYYYGGAVDGPPTASSTWVDINTTIPAATSGLNVYFWMENIGSNTDTYDVYWIYHEQDP